MTEQVVFDEVMTRAAAGVCYAKGADGHGCREKYGVGSWCSACLGHTLLERVVELRAAADALRSLPPLEDRISFLESQLEKVTIRARGYLEALSTTEIELIELRKQFDALTGERFSDRSHAALKARTAAAEAEVARLTAKISALDAAEGAPLGQEHPAWFLDCRAKGHTAVGTEGGATREYLCTTCHRMEVFP